MSEFRASVLKQTKVMVDNMHMEDLNRPPNLADITQSWPKYLIKILLI